MTTYNSRKKFYIDLLERVIWTFVQAFAAEWIATGSLGGNSLEVGLIAGAIAVAKCLIASRVGSPNTAALLPEGPDTDKGHGNTHLLAVVALILAAVALALILLR